MADINTPFSAADQALAFALCWFAASRRPDDPDVEMFAGVVREVLPFVSDAHPIVGPLAAAGGNLVRALDGGGPLAVSTAHLEVSLAVTNFAKWRAGRSFDAWRARKVAA